MLWQVHLRADDEPMGWFAVLSTRREAMQEARAHLKYGGYPKGIQVIYSTKPDAPSVVDACYSGYLVIEKTHYIYHGA